MLTLPLFCQDLVDLIRGAGGRPLVVGGAVRDALAGLVAKDIDLEVFGLDPSVLEEILVSAGFRVDAVGRAFGVLKVTAAGGETVDVSLPRRENKQGQGHRGFLVSPDPGMSFEDAAARRDFTINAMGWDPVAEVLLDPFGGSADLERRLLRHVGPAFAEDPMRVLRGVQLAGRFRLSAASETLEICRDMVSEYADLARERIWEEWRKWAAKAVEPSKGLSFLRQCGWIDLYPELAATIGCEQEPRWHPEGDVWTHTLFVCDAAASIAEREGQGPADRAVLLLAALVHDLGKPETTVLESGRVRSRGHAETVETYRAFLGRIGAPAGVSERVIVLSRRHLDHLGFCGSQRAVRRLARTLGEAGETLENLIRLVEADHSGRPPLPGGIPEGAARMLEVAREIDADRQAPQAILMGRDLIALGVEPGPEMGFLLRCAFEAQLDGAFGDHEGALEWAREHLRQGRDGLS